MPGSLIQINDSKKVFHLTGPGMSYVFQVLKSGYLAHLHWGARIQDTALAEKLELRDHAFSPNTDPSDRSFSLDTLCQEYPSYGHTDMGHPAYQCQLENGTTITDLRYVSHQVVKGKKKLPGLPATYVESDDEAETLELRLEDKVAGLEAVLSYTVFRHFPAIARSVSFANRGSAKIKILRALSVSLDFDGSDFDILHLPGAWARERDIDRKALGQGISSIESRRGASSHQQNPFLALLEKDANEDRGSVYGFSLVYSGNFLGMAEVNSYLRTRVSFGINPFDFSWLLEPKETFQTPEAVLAYSDEGLGKMSRTYHGLYRSRLVRGKWRDRPRPVLVNNWEATYFNFNAEKIETLAVQAKELGIELLVLDDGWFGKRDDDKSSLGDWFVHKGKLPGGIDGLAKKVKAAGIEFGLWFEPEMISPDSDLYRAHPDWCLHVPNRARSEARNQLILDLSRKEVRDAVVKMISDVLASGPISYVKWDMNRHMTEIGSAGLPPERQRETAHRYMLGLYEMLEAITGKFPDILFESCSGGGGRFDPGFLHYMPQTWTSDDSDAVARLKIQYGTSIVYPPSAMGAHVSAIPNHQVHRNTPLSFRAHVALAGAFGYELDLGQFSAVEKEEVKKQVTLYKEVRHLVQGGDFYRIKSPFENEGSDGVAWMFVSRDQKEAMVFYFQVLVRPNWKYKRFCLKGLDSEKKYQVEREGDKTERFGGDELMKVGLHTPQLHGDFQSAFYRLRAL